MTQMATIELFILLLIASTLVVLAARRVRLPYALALLVLGLGLGMTGATPPVQLTSRVILLLFLPPLLFEAAFALDLGLLWSQRRGVLALALPGVLLAAAVGGPLVHWATSLPWGVALLFGVMVAATDPVSVLATFRQLGVAPRLAVLVEGESLFNDGVSLALFGALVAAVGGAEEFSLGGLAFDFLWGMAGGAVVGALIGYLGVRLIRLVDEDLTEMAVSTAVAYGAFLAGEELHLSGVIAVLAAGMVLSLAGRAQGLSPASERRLDDLWEFLAFVANAALFLLMGLTVSATGLLERPSYVLWGIVAALAGRAAVAYGLGTLLGFVRFRLSWAERHVLFWGGLRGAVALAAALSLPPDFPARTELLAMTYGVVLFTLLAQGLTIDPLVRRLGLVAEREEVDEYENLRGRLSASEAGLQDLANQRDRGELGEVQYERLSEAYSRQREWLARRLADLQASSDGRSGRRERTAARRAALAEKAAVQGLYQRGAISEETLRTLDEEIDTRLESVADRPDEPA